jgi:hypothetical protein
VVLREVAEQGVHLDVVAYPVATNQECAQPEVHHRTKWAVLQWEALGEHLK